MSSADLPERCPICTLNWAYNPPAKVHGSDMVRCIDCKSTFPQPSPSSADKISDAKVEAARGSIIGCPFNDEQIRRMLIAAAATRRAQSAVVGDGEQSPSEAKVTDERVARGYDAALAEIPVSALRELRDGELYKIIRVALVAALTEEGA